VLADGDHAGASRRGSLTGAAAAVAGELSCRADGRGDSGWPGGGPWTTAGPSLPGGGGTGGGTGGAGGGTSGAGRDTGGAGRGTGGAGGGTGGAGGGTGRAFGV